MGTDLTRDGLERLRHEPVLGTDRYDGAVVVRLAGELDIANAPVIREALTAAAETQPERLVVDLAEVTFVDSTTLGVLIEARAKLSNRRAFLLAAPQRETRRALQVSGLDRHLVVHETVDAALAASV